MTGGEISESLKVQLDGINKMGKHATRFQWYSQLVTFTGVSRFHAAFIMVSYNSIL